MDTHSLSFLSKKNRIVLSVDSRTVVRDIKKVEEVSRSKFHIFVFGIFLKHQKEGQEPHGLLVVGILLQTPSIICKCYFCF
jgi:hypothetical protein